MSEKTMQDLIARAEQAIADEDDFVFDLAADQSQQVANIRHMSWFKKLVMHNLAGSQPEFQHLAPELA